MYDIIYKSDKVLINAFYYSFWMNKSEFIKYKPQTLQEFKNNK